MKKSPWRFCVAPSSRPLSAANLLRGGVGFIFSCIGSLSTHVSRTRYFRLLRISARYILIKILEDYLHKLMWCALSSSAQRKQAFGERGGERRKKAPKGVKADENWNLHREVMSFFLFLVSFHCARSGIFVFVFWSSAVGGGVPLKCMGNHCRSGRKRMEMDCKRTKTIKRFELQSCAASNPIAYSFELFWVQRSFTSSR